ncbi:MAG: hypothetical protein V1847_05360 [Candidatus Diapherotrites archaeon]
MNIDKNTIEMAGKAVLLIALVLFFLGVLTWLGFVKSNSIPGWCDVYKPVEQMLTGKRNIAIVYGPEGDGLGNPEKLAQALRNPNIAGTQADLVPLNRINQGNLQDYEIVIVTRAATMSAQQLQYFGDYIDQGGKLVWTGDAGSKGPDSERLYQDDLDVNAPHTLLDPWERKLEGKAVMLGKNYLSVEYVKNFCDAAPGGCGQDNMVGDLVTVGAATHPLIYGISSSLKLYGNFSLVKEPSSIGSRRVLSVDYGTNLQIEGVGDLGSVFPVIVTTGLGEKVTYYALPLESWLEQKDQEYPTFISNLYRSYRC